MVKCWLCGKNVKPETRNINCSMCHGHIVTPDPEKYVRANGERLTFGELKRMMESADTYERRSGRVKQKRHSKD